MRHLHYDTIECEGYKFRIGRGDVEAPVFMMCVNGEYHAALHVKSEGDEFGFMSGVYATKEHIKAIEEARKQLKERYNRV